MRMFKLNGQIYTKAYAWLPVQTTGDHSQWLWLCNYYVRVGRNGMKIMDYDTFQSDSNSFT